MAPDKVADGIVVAVAYTLKVGDDVLEEVNEASPLEYLHGAENIVLGLEKALTGKKIGDEFDVTVAPDEGYGEYDDELLEHIPREDFDSDEELEAGMEVTLEDEDGEFFDAIISEINDDEVIMDFNPPLAGMTLNYHVKVVGLRVPETLEREQGFPASLLDDLLEDVDDHADHNHN